MTEPGAYVCIDPQQHAVIITNKRIGGTIMPAQTLPPFFNGYDNERFTGT